MTKKILPAQAFRKLAALYADMESAYESHARDLGLSCVQCPMNCCTSFFQHHTRIEWAYLMQGLRLLPAEERTGYEQRAADYVRNATEALGRGEKPDIMCPLNNDGRCGLYQHRLMICRLHGVPNRLRYPNGRIVHFPGCFRSQALCENMESVPVLDRTHLYTRLMELEIQFVGAQRIRALPRVDLTLAEMIVLKTPQM